MNINEEWATIFGYEGVYEISSIGRIRRLAGKHCSNGRIIKLNTIRGYKYIILCKNNIRKSYKVHRLVALAFIPNPKNKFTVNHKDCDKSNNNVNNLEWATQTENIRHSWKLGRGKSNYPKPKKGDQNHLSKISDSQAIEIKEIYLSTVRGHRDIKGIALRYGISERHVIRIGRGQRQINNKI